ncbi:phosphate ABC transporter substrate-binding protein PstS family protein [Natronosalvus caseinilyticus]|uniref:phosphate ABC transporter substrate-binding protein PstS family protein n=1 Tax=Natronosalvus caseinilyticus TaxID=2953747 RepID=UPI0028ABADCE|nr:phosphate ABC transporter substrate-binding protein PstS family protein [Natronosalvus caseinilyticus]
MVDNQLRTVSGLATRRKVIAATGAVGTGLIAGCAENEASGDGNSGNGGNANGNGNGNGNTENTVEGTVRISGSSTVFPVSEAAGEEFSTMHGGFEYELSSDGSTGGIENFFIPGESAVTGSSRPILEEEIEGCQDTGFQPIEFQCAGDALTAIVNPENDWLDCVDYETMQEVWLPDDAPETWADIDPEWPDEEIELFGPATTSGTYDYWTGEVLDDFRSIREDFQGTEEDDLIAEGVAGNPYAHGYLPYAYYDNNPEGIKALEFDGGDGCTAPSLEAASDGSYPLARPIFWYVNQNKLQEDEAVQAFVEFAIELSGDFEIVSEEIGYVAMNDDEVQENLERLQAAIDGEISDEDAIPSAN